MRFDLKIVFGLFLLYCNLVFSQNENSQRDDISLKDSIYKANKTKVLNYSMKDFQNLFFEFSKKQFDPTILLTKKEFYTYTIKIATFSDRLANLYPEEREVAQANKKKMVVRKL
jgi:hypothetical protein